MKVERESNGMVSQITVYFLDDSQTLILDEMRSFVALVEKNVRIIISDSCWDECPG